MTGARRSSADLLLHPVRLRIVQSLLGEGNLTTADLQRQLPEVAPATLYRQVATLVAGDVIEVTAERRIRGAVERTYRLRVHNASVRPDDLAALSAEEHRAAFLTFIAGLIADFDRYLARGDPNLLRDGVGYRQAAFYATDGELAVVTAAIGAAVIPWLAAEATPARTRRVLTTVLLPGGSAAGAIPTGSAPRVPRDQGEKVADPGSAATLAP